MIRNTTKAAVALALACASTGLALSPVRPYTPQWSVGTSWALKTEFRKMASRNGEEALNLSRPNATPSSLSWSLPVTFVYTVADKQEAAGKTTFRIHAEPTDTKSGFATDITVVAADGKLSVAGVTTRHRRQGQIVKDTESYPAPMPVFTESSIIPYDAPVFPLVKAADMGISNYLNAKRKFQRVEQSGGLKFARTHSQLVSNQSLSSYVDQGGQPVTFAVEVPASDVIPVEMKEETTGARVVQYWAHGRPWAVYSENASSRSWLVKP